MGRKLDTLGRGPGVTQAYHRVGGRVEAKTTDGDGTFDAGRGGRCETPLGIAERAHFDAARRTMRRKSLNVHWRISTPQVRFPWELGGLLYTIRCGISMRF